MRVGELFRTEEFPKARKQRINYGDEIGIKQSSAQITDWDK